MYPRMLACATLGVHVNRLRSGACPRSPAVRALTYHPRSPAVRASLRSPAVRARPRSSALACRRARLRSPSVGAHLPSALVVRAQNVMRLFVVSEVNL